MVLATLQKGWVVSGCLRSCRDACPCPFNGKAVTPWQALPSLFFFSHREKSSEPKNIIAHCLPALRVPRMPSSPTFICCDHEMFKKRKRGGKKKKGLRLFFLSRYSRGLSLELHPWEGVLIASSTSVYTILQNFGRNQEHIPGCWLL